YLRFLYGVVDSEDLPLNVSRETLQDNSVFRKIRGVVVKRLIDRMGVLAAEKPDDYRKFHAQFGRILKEGVNTDWDNRDRLAKLLLFTSSASEEPDVQTSLDAYCDRAGEAQNQIYYIGGPDLPSIKKNPNLEIFRKRNLEVLYLPDPIDDFVLASLGKYRDKKLISIDSADLELPATAPELETPPTAPTSGFGRVLELFRDALAGKVKDVVESKRLTDSPCCLVNSDDGASVQMQKILKMHDPNYKFSLRVLEVNPKAALVERLAALAANPANDAFLGQCGRQLYDGTMLLEGLAPEPQDVVSRMQEFMTEAAERRTTILEA
ncbi:MAG: molecular chaperone HtpG, partial [Planctomycetia bacterium]